MPPKSLSNPSISLILYHISTVYPKLITSFAQITANPLVLSMCPFQHTPISSSSPTLLPEQSFHVHVHFHFNLSKTLQSLSLPSWGKDSTPYKACELLYSMFLWPFQSHLLSADSSHATPAAQTFVVPCTCRVPF